MYKSNLKRCRFERVFKTDKIWDKLKLYLLFYKRVIFSSIFTGILTSVILQIIYGCSFNEFCLSILNTIPLQAILTVIMILFLLIIISFLYIAPIFIPLIFITVFILAVLTTDFLFCSILSSPKKLELIATLSSPIVSLFIGLLVYRYTTNNNRRQLIDSLDSKSEWRKSLFMLAHKQKIKPKDIHILRATLRFNYKRENKTYFDIMTKFIILYCEGVEKNKTSSFILNYNNDITFATRFDPKIVRLFARYLLADHWEKNLFDNRQTAIYRLLNDLRIITDHDLNNLFKFIKVQLNKEVIEKKLNYSIQNNHLTLFESIKNTLYSILIFIHQILKLVLFTQNRNSNIHLNKQTNYGFLKKENELFIHTFTKFVEFSNEIS